MPGSGKSTSRPEPPGTPTTSRSEILLGPDSHSVMIPRSWGLTRAQARYRGYREVDHEIGVGHFYPDDWFVKVAYLRPNAYGDPNGEFTHERCSKNAEGAEAYWYVEYQEQPREWRNGQWRKKVAA